MKNKQIVLTLGVISTGIISALMVKRVKKNRRNTKSKEFIEELQKQLLPGISALEEAPAFSSGFIKGVLDAEQGVKALSSKAALQMAKEIHESIGFWSNDMNRILGILRNLESQVMVSQVAQSYYREYGENLIDVFKAKLNDDALRQVISIINLKPAFIKTKGNGLVATPSWLDPFDMNYKTEVANWIAPRKLILMPPPKAIGLAKQIKEAKSFWDDNESSVEEVFHKQLKDKVQVAQLSHAFYFETTPKRQDLYEYLRSFLSESEMEKYVHSAIRRLPNYRIQNNE